MKQDAREEAARFSAALEEGVSVTAGSFDTSAFYEAVERQREASEEKEQPFAAVLGMFLNLARRERAIGLRELADQIETDPLDLMLIEKGSRVPEPRIISKLARALGVRPGKLMQLAGHVESLDASVSSAAYAFLASASTAPLEPNEKAALNEFVKALSSDQES